jgi:hypothetical protein
MGSDRTSRTCTTDALLVQARFSAGDMAPALALLKSLNKVLPSVAQPSHAAFNRAQGIFYAYLHLDARNDVAVTDLADMALELGKQGPQVRDLRISRLERMLEVAGASAGEPPVFHYVVEMDPDSGWMPELSDWYDTEHMPGLAKVRGCIRARRFLNHDHGPLSLACYDLVTEETLGSPPWLAVRGTAWSSRMRPHFTNTLRTMFEVIR